MAELVKLIDGGQISGKIAKTVFDALLDSPGSPQEIVAERGLEQVSDSATLDGSIEEVLAAHAKQVADYRGGNDRVFGFLVGQVMKATHGKANPQMVNELLKRKLASS
jgi:aspartyl-tRNA(Asn)/glutamyl-tRNA(Gln) amidotransferase subunit B